MPILNVYVSDDCLSTLQRHSRQTGRPVDELASAAIENEASKIEPCPSGELPSGYFHLIDRAMYNRERDRG